MEHTLSMTFITEKGIKTNFSVSGVKEDLTKDQINALMDTIIAKNIFRTNSGDFVKKSTAQITQRQVTKFDVA